MKNILFRAAAVFLGYTVLIAAAFCMFNRYVDGLNTWQPGDLNDCREMGQIMAHVGYVRPDWEETGEAA